MVGKRQAIALTRHPQRVEREYAIHIIPAATARTDFGVRPHDPASRPPVQAR